MFFVVYASQIFLIFSFIYLIYIFISFIYFFVISKYYFCLNFLNYSRANLMTRMSIKTSRAVPKCVQENRRKSELHLFSTVREKIKQSSFLHALCYAQMHCTNLKTTTTKANIFFTKNLDPLRIEQPYRSIYQK